MAATATSEVNEGPVLSLINKRLRALRKKQNRIAQMEEAIAQGKTLNKEQEDVLKSKPSVSASIDELEKLRQPLAAAVAEEISLAVEHYQKVPPAAATAADSDAKDEGRDAAETESEMTKEDVVVEDLLNLLYFGTMFDVRNHNDFTSTMLTRTHERTCCLVYDYVTDDEATSDLLGDRDLDLISMLGGLLISRPKDLKVSHKNALQRCLEHAKEWLAHSDKPIDQDSNVTYAGLREKLNKIRGSDYFTTSPEMKATVEMAAAAAGNYASFQMPGSLAPVSQIQVESSHEKYNQKEVEDSENPQTNGAYDNLSSPEDEPHKDEFVSETAREIPSQTEQGELHSEEQNQRDVESKEHHHHHGSRRYHRGGGRGGARRGFPNGRGGRGSSRGGGPYQNGRGGGQYYDQSGNFYPRSYYNQRGRGGRGGSGGGNYYNNHSSGGQAAYATAES